MKFLLDIEEQLHKDLKMFAANNKQTMNETIAVAIEKYIYKQEVEE